MDPPFNQPSPSRNDRVFPIKSAVSVDPSPTPSIRPETYGIDGFPVTATAIDTSESSLREHRSYQPSISSTSSTRKSHDHIEALARVHHGIESRDMATTEANRRNSSVEEAIGKDQTGRTLHFQKSTDASSRQSEKTSSDAGYITDSTLGSTRNLPEDPGDILTTRFKHVVTDEGHAIIVGHDEDKVQRCEDEPIHIPGAIQSFGLLIALQELDEGKFRVEVVSENSQRLIGYTPKQLFALDSICDILSEEQAENLLDHVDFIRDGDADPAMYGPDVFTLAIRSPRRSVTKLWCAMHVNENNRDLIICEFELEDDKINPLVPVDEMIPETPEDTINSNPSAEEYAESTENSSKPLRVLRSARTRKGEAAAMEVFNIMSQVQEQLANAPNLELFLKVLVGVIKELTGFHRVMVYQFDQAWNGKVVTELVDPAATKDLYKGLNFPASDIPQQARELYKINKVRLLYDRDQETSRLVCRTVEDLKTPLDLTFAYLRAMSPVHIKYLANMAVRASMSISINAFNDLWGLIACHSYSQRGMRVSFPIRKMCRLIGDSASRNIERLSYASRLQARKLINTVPTESSPSGYIVASSDDLLDLFDAEYGLLSIRGQTKVLGKLEQSHEPLAMLEYLRLRKINSVLSSNDIRADFPDLRYAPGFAVIAGFLLVPLSVGGNDFIVFFRKGQTQEVKWAGNPYEKSIKDGTNAYLEPRKSFKMWSETVVGKSRAWTEEQIETAAVLCLVYGKFIEVWRQKEEALAHSQLTSLLISNSAHEVRTPLNAIINYLEIALEGALDSETRENLVRSHSASKTLIYVINDLLDLTKTEEGLSLIKDEVFDLHSTVREATDMFSGDAKRKELSYELIEHPGVPQYVIGDQRRVRQVITNVTANAIQHTSSGAVKVELWLAGHAESRAEVDIVIQDTGVGMSVTKLDRLFRDLEQVQSEGEDGLQEQLSSSSSLAIDNKHDPKILGLGLALVARIVRNMNGQLRLKSEEGKGSRFVIQLGFDLPKDYKGQEISTDLIADGVDQMAQPCTPPLEVGEILLVNPSAQKMHPSTPRKDISRRRSNDSVKSIASLKSFKSGSSAIGDVDRLIDAIHEPRTLYKSSLDMGKDSPTEGSHLTRLSLLSPRRASILATSQSIGNTSTSSTVMAAQGEYLVNDSGTSIKPVRMPNEDSQNASAPEIAPPRPAKMLFNVSDKTTNKSEPFTTDELHVLVAEDDPINSKIVKKRLEKLEHVVHLTINGEECYRAYEERPRFYDVVLMDMQVRENVIMVATNMI